LVAQAADELAQVEAKVDSVASSSSVDAAAGQRLSSESKRLDRGLARLDRGSGELARGISRGVDGAQLLASSAGRLQVGMSALSAGIDALGAGPDGGSRRLEAGISAAARGAQQLDNGLGRMLARVTGFQNDLERSDNALARFGGDSEGATSSGYALLATIDSADPSVRENASFAFNLNRGGTVARVYAVSAKDPFDADTQALRPRIEREVGAAARALGARATVGGVPTLLSDFDRQADARLVVFLLILVFATFIALLVLFRSPVLAFCAVLLNLLTLGVSLGALVFLYQGQPSILSGPGSLDAIAMSATIGVVFGLSIDYQVFLIMRLLEGRALTGTTSGAISYGVDRTARVITGAALMMAGVFATFSVPDLQTLRQLGIALTIAVLLDATVVRLLLLPALVRLFGERTWDTPRWLDSLLPRIRIHG
jgi:RND superfamily putative drug exporter